MRSRSPSFPLLSLLLLLLCLSAPLSAWAQNNAAFVSQSVPTVMVAGERYSVSVTMRNTGTTTWTPGAAPYCHRLGPQNPQDNPTWGIIRADLPSSVAPGGQMTIPFTVVAPSTPGTYNFQWRMLYEGVAWFGDYTPNVAVNVTPTTNGNAAAFVSQAVPTTMTAGQSYSVSVTMRNTGTAAWTPGAAPYRHRLGSQNLQDNLTWGLGRAELPSSVAPGAQVTIPFTVVAPSRAGTYNFQWRMLYEGVEWFGAYTQNVAVTVSGASGGGLLSGDIPAPAWAEDVLPTDASEADGPGPSSADAVNLASGVYENRPGPDLVARNPVGPDAEFSRLYYSGQAARDYASPGLSVGWMHGYDVRVQGPAQPGTWGALTLVYPNGAAEALTPVFNNGNPTGALTPQGGSPYVVSGQPSGIAGQWNWLQFTFPDETRWTFRLLTGSADTYQLRQITNGLGQSLWVNYSGTRVSAIVNDASTALLSFTYDGGGYLASVADAYGRQVRYSFGAGPGAVCLFQVSQLGSSTAAQWVYGYSTVGSKPFLSTVAVPNPTGGGATLSHPIEYDYASGRVTALVDANGNRRVYTYNGGSTRVEVKNASGAVVQAWTQNVGARNVDVGTTDAASQSTSILYDGYRPTRSTNENGQQVVVTYDTWGNLSTVTDPSNLITTYSYDYATFGLGRLASVKVGSKTETRLSYYPNGLLQTVQTPRPGSISGASQWVSTSYTYTALGNVSQLTLPGNNAAAAVTYIYNYTNDPLDGYSKTEALSEPVTITNPLGKVTHFRYDARGSVTAVIDAAGIRTDFTYNTADQLTRITYPATGQNPSARASATYDYLYPGGPLRAETLTNESGQQVRQVNYGRGAEGEDTSQTGSAPQVSIGYDGRYRLKAVADGKGQTTQHSFDAVGNRTERVFPGGDRIQWPQHDPAGNVLQRRDGRNQLTRYTRAPDDSRIAGISYDSQASDNVTFEHDLYGRVSRMSDGSGVTTYSYDDLDNVLSVQTDYKKPDGTYKRVGIICSYHPDGSRSHVSATNTSGFSYNYDAAKRMISVTGGGTGIAAQWTYLDNGWLKTQETGVGGGGLRTTYTYNARGQLIDLLNQNRYSNATISEYTLTYDAAGNRIAMVSNLPQWPAFNESVTYTYDTKDQLINESSTGTYACDAAGNLTVFAGASRSYNSNNQRTGNGFAYDGNGNPTTYQGTGLTFDGENRLKSVSGQVTCGYRGDGLRAWKQNASGQRTYFLYDGNTVLAEYAAEDGVGIPPRSVNVLGANGLLWRDTEDGPVLYAFDPQGNTAQRLSYQGAVLAYHKTSAWGTHQFQFATPYADTPRMRADPFQGYKAQWGYYLDVETGLYALSYRYYDASTGRFLTRDPIGYEGGINLYAYCENNPLKYVDPDGLKVNIVSGLPPRTIEVVQRNQQGQKVSYRATFSGWNKGQELGKVDQSLRDIYATKRGRELLKSALQKNIQVVKLHGSTASFSGKYNGAYVIYLNVKNPTTTGLVRDKRTGRVKETTFAPSMRRVLAHELGHAVTELKDDGPGYLNATKANDNPIAAEWGEPIRTRYP